LAVAWLAIYRTIVVSCPAGRTGIGKRLVVVNNAAVADIGLPNMLALYPTFNPVA
jgi:hypothetical protein